MTFTLSAKSRERLSGVHPDLVRVVERAIGLSPQDFFVVEGVRSRDAMAENWGKGRTADQCKAAGVPVIFAKPSAPKVTWLRDPYTSNHRAINGLGRAVDLGALVDGKYDGAHQGPYDAIALAMFKAASVEKVAIRWGGDWDGDGHAHEHGETDLAHFELHA